MLRAIVAPGGGAGRLGVPYWGYAGADAGGTRRAPRCPRRSPRASCPTAPRTRSTAPTASARAFLNRRLPAAGGRDGARAGAAAPAFSPGSAGLPGGPRARRSTRRRPGLLEAQPHDSVAAALGRDAALDPVFPLHLAAVDRLWEIVARAGRHRENPAAVRLGRPVVLLLRRRRPRRSLTCGQAGDLGTSTTRTRACAAASAEHVLTAATPTPARCRAPAASGGSRRGAGPSSSSAPSRGASPCARRDGPRRGAAAGRRRRAGRLYLHLEDARAGSGSGGSVWEVRVEGGRVRRAETSCDASARSRSPAATTSAALRLRRHRRRRRRRAAWDDRALAVTFHPALPAGSRAARRSSARVGNVFLTHD